MEREEPEDDTSVDHDAWEEECEELEERIDAVEDRLDELGG